VNLTLILFQFLVLILSVIIHEVSHGLMAEKLGDPTARLAGRITLNPIKHIDIFGSILLPLFLVLSGSPVVLGWAKPVPYNPLNTKDPRTAGGKIAFAGPLSNFILAVIFSAFLRIGQIVGLSGDMLLLFMEVIIVNLSLGVFNLVPIPPLDGSKVLFSLLPPTRQVYRFAETMERYGFIILIVFIYAGSRFLAPVISWLFYWLAGRPF
jgi:Zn-dependent protease